ncbi:MAG: type II toxin-antitoxin system Phd/YefM family antitoxin [Deltaproteobacteria bacterium]|nr:type II toxin-antitoxin system Phd/YefM family antitoxin [Deltaproteobacteria bacterium]
MKVYTYSEARQHFAEILNIAREEEVIIQRRGGEVFTIACKKKPRSPFAIPGIKTKATTKDILRAVKDSRERMAEQVKQQNVRSPRR